ncbi:SdpI family protein [Macrococcus brunensis]|uniref:SdpI family protein n=1 Tax=Macrococcus brunensis TaxID=198483 RepID=A0A4R6BEE4_9STAP|nr:SdpI family protein [Macrococcus brunensis]TDL98073.1 SdpI family protein [Macrococcus brunensis]
MILCLSSLMLFLIARMMEHSPEKEINHWMGYRSRQSMASQKNWDIAQIYSMKIMKNLFYRSFLISIILIGIDIFLINRSENQFLISITVQTAVLMYLLYLVFKKTEDRLKEKRDS